MVSANWTDDVLMVCDGGQQVASGRILLQGGEWFLEQIVVTPTLDCVHGDFLVRLMLRRIYDLGGYEQYVYAKHIDRGFYQKLGFEVQSDTGLLIKMRRTGDVLGRC